MTDATNKTYEQRKKEDHELIVIRDEGDLSKSLNAIRSMFQSYIDMAGRFVEMKRKFDDYFNNVRKVDANIGTRFIALKRSNVLTRKCLRKADSDSIAKYVELSLDESERISEDIESLKDITRSAKNSFGTLREAVKVWSKTVPLVRERCNAAFNVVADFKKVAEREMVDCVRSYVAKLDAEIGTDGEAEIVDDAKFAALLTRIESAAPMDAMVMTRKAHQDAVACIRRLDDKVAGMKLKTTQRGATGPEAETAAAMILRFERIIEVARGRDNVLRDHNRSICAAIRTEVDKNEVSEVKKVKLTKAQKKALEEMK